MITRVVSQRRGRRRERIWLGETWYETGQRLMLYECRKKYELGLDQSNNRETLIFEEHPLVPLLNKKTHTVHALHITITKP